MKTLRALRITSVLQIIFCLFCIASLTCFAIYRWYDIDLLFYIGGLLVYGWMINPISIISFVICLFCFLPERKDPEARQIMGKKWIWVFIWPVITTLVWLFGGVVFVSLTGGV